jgi:hypothetical protein
MERNINIVFSLIAISVIIYAMLEYNTYIPWLILLFFLLLVLKFMISPEKCKYYLYRYFKYIFVPKKAYIMNLRETYYEFKSRTKMIHKRKFEIRSCVNNLEAFTDRYRWSKEQNCVIVPLVRNQEIMHEWEEYGWKFYSVKFDRQYFKNDSVNVLTSIENLDDEKNESKLFLSTGIYEKTKLLRMIVKFNKDLSPHQIKLRISKDFINNATCFEYDLDYDYDKRQILYEHKYPLYGYRYMILWSFK